jgi:hypothetical protein
MRTTRSRGLGTGRTLRDRPPTPRNSGAASVLRTPYPNRTRGSASRESTAILPNRDEQTDEETHPNQESQPDIAAVQPQIDQQEQGDPGNNGEQPASVLYILASCNKSLYDN